MCVDNNGLVMGLVFNQALDRALNNDEELRSNRALLDQRLAGTEGFHYEHACNFVPLFFPETLQEWNCVVAVKTIG